MKMTRVDVQECEMEEAQEADTESPPFVSNEGYNIASHSDPQLLNAMTYARRCTLLLRDPAN